jgi:3-deoxy-manno-octulosonate cytidylyltransferase (CMP-KDO synthetase)
MVSCHGIIPARYASVRFPGKPLADIAGKPMIWHVYERARQCAALQSVTVATDDARIMRAAEELGMNCVPTRPDHPSGTDRVYEAARLLGIADDAVVVNIQGDEPLLDPNALDALVAPFAPCSQEAATVQASTLAVEVDGERALSPNQVKVVTATSGDALYFSRALIPHVRDGKAGSRSYLGHIGLYAFRMRVLARFVELPPSSLEQAEKLEQLRLLENGIPIRVVLVERHNPGVDTPEDLQRVLRILSETGGNGV